MWVYVGARVRGGLAWRAPTCLRCGDGGGLACADAARDVHAPRVRSGLAYAAGFAGLAVLFRPGLGTFFLWELGFHNTAGLVLYLLAGLVAPAALALGFAAGAALDRERGKSGRPQALLGFLVGLMGTFAWLAEVAAFARFLGYF